MAPREAKLTDADVERILSLWNQDYSMTTLAERYGVSISYISRLIRGVRRGPAGVNHESV